MDFDEEEGDIVLLSYYSPSGVINLPSILGKSRRQLVWVQAWLQRRSTKAFTTLYRKIKTTRVL